MNVRERVEVENKKNIDSLSLGCYHVNCLCLSRKILIEKEMKKKKERKKILIEHKPN